MRNVELLTIKDSFQIDERGVIVIPDFSVPKGWTNRTETVTVAKPDGQQFEATAEFNMTHLRIPDPKVALDKRWRVIVLLLKRKKEELPVGSKILTSPDVRDLLLGKTEANPETP